MSNHVYDVIVIGAGPSGMMAAGRAAERGKRVLLIEKNKVFGKKLSITGGGRCNILNAEENERALIAHYGDAGKYLFSAFAQHGMQDSWDFFESRGLPLVVEARKRAFPETQSAEDVTRVMEQYVKQNNVELKLKTKVTEILTDGGIVTAVKTNNGTFNCKKLIMSTGGASHQETGSTGEGFSWLTDLGHTVHAPSPDIVPLTVEDEWVKNASGKTLSFMKITFASARSKKEGKFSKTGKILFTHFGLSGPLILNSSRQVSELLQSGPVEATIDMYPDTEINVLRNRVLEVFNANKNKALKNVLKEFVPAGMSSVVAEQLDEEFLETKVNEVTKEMRNALSDRLKAMPLTITGTKGMDWAVISDGGVDLKEVDTKTMRSKLYENLYLTGDVLHINRPSGGFSLQLCWTTGWVAGSHV